MSKTSFGLCGTSIAAFGLWWLEKRKKAKKGRANDCEPLLTAVAEQVSPVAVCGICPAFSMYGFDNGYYDFGTKHAYNI